MSPVTQIDSGQERDRRSIGRPAKAEPFRPWVVDVLTREPDLSVEIFRRAQLAGYTGRKTALYELVSALRRTTVRPLVRFEGLAGEFSQHDFGQVDVRFLDGTWKRVHFFASRLKYSPWAEVTIVPDECAETLVRVLVDHFAAIGGIPLLAVFDRPTTIALKWTKDGQVTEWNALFAGVALDVALGIEVCWPSRPEQNAYVERFMGSVRRACLDHVIVCNERGLRGVLNAYMESYLRSRTHLALDKDAPVSRPVARPSHGGIVAIPQVGGLHHRYERRAA